MIDVAARFGDNLARLRKGADLSQEELSVRASLHRTEISQLERGLRIARVDTLVKLLARSKSQRRSFSSAWTGALGTCAMGRSWREVPDEGFIQSQRPPQSFIPHRDQTQALRTRASSHQPDPAPATRAQLPIEGPTETPSSHPSYSPTHYEPLRFVPGPPFGGPKRQEGSGVIALATPAVP